MTAYNHVRIRPVRCGVRCEAVAPVSDHADTIRLNVASNSDAMRELFAALGRAYVPGR